MKVASLLPISRPVKQ